MTNQSKLIARLKQQPRHGKNVMDEFNDALKQVFETYQQGAGDLMRDNVFKTLAKNVQDTYEEVSVLEKRNRGLSDSLKISTSRAAALSQEFDKQADKLKINSAKLKQYAGELNKLIPGQTRFLKNAGGLGAKIAEQSELMRNKLKLTDEQYQQLLKNQTLFAGSNETVSQGMDKFTEILKQSAIEAGTTFEAVEATIAETVASMDSEAAARFGRMSKENFVKAALAAKKLGVEMNTLLGIGDSFLDVESAIATELELQLLGAKDLNVAAIQKAALTGDALALEKELENFVKANGEQLKQNPILLEKSAAAFGVQKSALLDMYAQLKLNNEAEAEAGKIAQDTNKTLEDRLDIRTEKEKLQDQAALAETAAILQKYDTPDKMREQVTAISAEAQRAQAAALSGAEGIAKALSNNEWINTLKATVQTYNSLTGLAGAMKPGAGAAISDEVLGRKNDLFIPASGDNTVISGPFGAFTMNPGDDILAAPNIREAGSGGSAAAVIAALSKMAFHVTNVFDGDKIKSSLEIRQGQTLNNINNIA